MFPADKEFITIDADYSDAVGLPGNPNTQPGHLEERNQ